MENLIYRIEDGEYRMPVSEMNRINDEWKRLENQSLELEAKILLAKEEASEARKELIKEAEEKGFVIIKEETGMNNNYQQNYMGDWENVPSYTVSFKFADEHQKNRIMNDLRFEMMNDMQTRKELGKLMAKYSLIDVLKMRSGN